MSQMCLGCPLLLLGFLFDSLLILPVFFHLGQVFLIHGLTHRLEQVDFRGKQIGLNALGLVEAPFVRTANLVKHGFVDWWYHLAHEEAIWVEERDDQKQGTGVFYKPLSREEAEQILEPHISPYRTMNIDELLALVGQTTTMTGISSQGTPYKIKTEVRRWDWDKERIRVEAVVDDCLGWGWRLSVSVDRDLPEPVVVETEEWAKEGF